MNENLDNIQQVIGYQFSDIRLLQTALTHSSFNSEDCYERLEFLGDRVLAIVISHWLYEHFDAADQGELTKRFHALACRDMLAEICVDMGLNHYIRYGKSATDLANLPSIQSDVIEAVIAAIYLDGGSDAASQFIKRYWNINNTQKAIISDNPKSALQEWTATKQLPLPVYQLVSRVGLDHAPEFLVQVEIQGFDPELGQGKSRKIAERTAAKIFMNKHII